MIDKILELISSHNKQELEKMILDESEAIHNFLENPQMKGIWSEISVKQDINFYMKSFDLDNKGEGIYDMLIEQNKQDGIQTN
jgi:hypothetical protein